MRIHRTLTLFGASAAACLALAGSLSAQETKAKCPVAGKEFVISEKTPSVMVNGQKLTFCCTNCPKAFAANPEKFVKSAGNCPVNTNGPAQVTAENRTVVNNDLFYVCCAGCATPLQTNPANFAKKLVDPVTGKEFAPKASSPRASAAGRLFFFATPESKAAFEKESAKYIYLYK